VRTGKSPEPHRLEAVVCLQVGEAHLNTLSLVSRFGKRLCLHLPSCDIAASSRISRGILRASAVVQHSYWAHIAVPLRGAVEQRPSVVYDATGLQQFSVGAEVDPALPVPVEIRTGEKMPFCRSAFSHTGMCGMNFFV
jgi:hypothetical protein